MEKWDSRLGLGPKVLGGVLYKNREAREPRASNA